MNDKELATGIENDLNDRMKFLTDNLENPEIVNLRHVWKIATTALTINLIVLVIAIIAVVKFLSFAWYIKLICVCMFFTVFTVMQLFSMIKTLVYEEKFDRKYNEWKKHLKVHNETN